MFRRYLQWISLLAALSACSADRSLPSGSTDSAAVASHADSSEQSLSAPTLSYVAREGRALFLHYCATCHGERGRGDGFNAYNLDPKPRDLSEIEFQAARSDDDLSELIRIGGAAAGLSTTMPPWGGTINERGIHYLVSYLRELRTQPDEAAADEE